MLEWGITDLMDNGNRQEGVRFLYVKALEGWEKHTENWQPEVNKLLDQIGSVIKPLIVDEPARRTWTASLARGRATSMAWRLGQL